MILPIVTELSTISKGQHVYAGMIIIDIEKEVFMTSMRTATLARVSSKAQED